MVGSVPLESPLHTGHTHTHTHTHTHRYTHTHSAVTGLEFCSFSPYQRTERGSFRSGEPHPLWSKVLWGGSGGREREGVWVGREREGERGRERDERERETREFPRERERDRSDRQTFRQTDRRDRPDSCESRGDQRERERALSVREPCCAKSRPELVVISV